MQLAIDSPTHTSKAPASDRAPRVIIACGGTGGHLFPGIAVAQEWKRQGGEAAVLISQKQIDALATQGHSEIRFETMPAIAMPRGLSPRLIPFGFRLASSVASCAGLIRSFKADAVLGMGGFTSMPPLLAARLLRKPGFIHESNAFPGKSNRLSAKFAKSVLLGMEECAQYFPGRDTKVVGTPIRTALANGADRAEALSHFGLAPGPQTLLVMGGSQGARGVNRAAAKAAAALDPEKFQIIHISGPGDHDEVKTAYAEVKAPHHIAPFCHRMEFAYAAADLAISRAGASSLTELSYFGLPSILVPYPTAADDHQTKNANVFAKAGAAILVTEKEIEATGLSGLVLELLGSPDRLKKLKESSLSLGVKDAATQICSIIKAFCDG